VSVSVTGCQRDDLGESTVFGYVYGFAVSAARILPGHQAKNWLSTNIVDSMAPTTGWAGNEDELFDVLYNFAGIGSDEIHLIPTSSDVHQLRCDAVLAKCFT
jgi:hypothetical protein